MAIGVRLAVLALLGLIVSISFAHTSTTSPVARGLLVPDPTEDPFYQPPAGFEKEAPGTILRNRTIVTALEGILPNPIKTYHLLYRTTGIDGSPTAAVTTIFVPWKPRTDRFLSFQSAYNSVSIQCAPSYQWRLGAPQGDFIANHQLPTTIFSYLLMDLIVTSPDYEGLDGAFIVGRLEAHAILDGMRAVTNFRDTLGLTTGNPKIIGDGYSAAGIATGWAAALQPSYAPELNIKGWSAGGVPANLTSTIINIDDTFYSGFVPPMIAGLAKPTSYGKQLKPVIDDIFNPRGRELIEAANDRCPISELLTFFEMSITSTKFQKLGPGIFQEPTFADILSHNTMGVVKSETPTAPTFIYHGVKDEIFPYADVEALTDSWCEKGAAVHFITYENAGHVPLELISLPDVFHFVNAAFEDKVDTNACSRRTELRSKLDPRALVGNLGPFAEKVVDKITHLGEKGSLLF